MQERELNLCNSVYISESIKSGKWQRC